ERKADHLRGDAQAAAYRLRGAQIRSALRPRTGACSVRGKTVSTRRCARTVGRSAFFRPPITVCIEAPSGGQRVRVVHPTSPIRRSSGRRDRRAAGVFPAAVCGENRLIGCRPTPVAVLIPQPYRPPLAGGLS